MEDDSAARVVDDRGGIGARGDPGTTDQWKDAAVKKTTRTLVAAPIAALLVLAGGASAYAAHYRDLALPGSEVAGMSVSGLSRAEVAKVVRDRAAKVEVTVVAGDSSRKTSLAELGYAVDIDGTVAKVFSANGTWSSYAQALVSSRSIPAVVRVDDKAVAGSVAALVAAKGTPSVNAHVDLAPGATTFTVTPDVPGTTVDPASLQQVAQKAAATLTSATATVKFVTGKALIGTAQAQAAADKANALVAVPVTITAGDKTLTATEAEKAGWVKIPATDSALGAPAVDPAAVTAWVTAQAEAVKVGAVEGQRTLSSATGAVLRVTREARDGSEVANAASVVEAAVAALGAGKPFAGTFETTSIPASWSERRVAAGAENLAYPAADGEKWVDVNLSEHTMTAYEGGRAVIGPVLMVNGAPATPTVTGTFAIYAKYESQTMRGQNADGTSYEAKDVPWVSYFTGGYALHGAPWRDSFGYTGSHGCINLPVSVAQQVFNWAPMGTVVVGHY